MSHYDYKGYAIVSCIIASDVAPARVSVKVWKAGASHLHDVPVYFCKSLEQARTWIDGGACVPMVPATNRRVLAYWH